MLVDLFIACRIDPSEIVIGKMVGAGIGGTVHAATWRGSTVAVKTLRHDASLFSAWETFLKEAMTMRKISNHANVLHFCGIMVQDRVISIVTGILSF